MENRKDVMVKKSFGFCFIFNCLKTNSNIDNSSHIILKSKFDILDSNI